MSYETDILVYDEFDDKSWIPRVIVECKLGSVTTHDAPTYIAKAATHKHVHPYLRYGILLGEWGCYPLPPRLVRHGTYFDFMATRVSSNPDEWEWSQMSDVIAKEIVASRFLQRSLRSPAPLIKIKWQRRKTFDHFAESFLLSL